MSIDARVNQPTKKIPHPNLKKNNLFSQNRFQKNGFERENVVFSKMVKPDSTKCKKLNNIRVDP